MKCVSSPNSPLPCLPEYWRAHLSYLLRDETRLIACLSILANNYTREYFGKLLLRFKLSIRYYFSDSLWSRVSEIATVFNEERATVRDIRKMKPDSVPVGVDCTLSPILLKNASNGQSTRVEFNANCNVSSTTVAVTPTKSSFAAVKRVVCSPDLPVVYPVIPTTTSSATTATVRSVVDSPTTPRQPSAQGGPLFYCIYAYLQSGEFSHRLSSFRRCDAS